MYALDNREIATGEFPFAQYTGLAFLRALKAGVRPTISDEVAAKVAYRDLIVSCWHQQPEERPHIEQVLERITGIYNDYAKELAQTQLA